MPDWYALSEETKQTTLTMYTNHLLNIFGKLRPVTSGQHWPDYIELGVTSEHIPDLIDQATSKDWLFMLMDSQSDVPVHAWRSLAQLKAKDAIEQLLAIIEPLQENDMAFEELPKVLSMMGVDVIEPVTQYLNDFSNEEFARIVVVQALILLAKDTPEHQTLITEKLIDYLRNHDPVAIELNALIVHRLIQYEAVEEEIHNIVRKLYQLGHVDLSTIGDLEDVEIAFGWRHKRTTPHPHYRALHPRHIANEIDPHRKPRTKQERYNRIESYLSNFGDENSLLMTSELDGFLTAIACAPQSIPPDRWMPAIWGAKKAIPDKLDQAQIKDFVSLATSLYSEIKDMVDNGRCNAMFLTTEIDGKTYTFVNCWCEGFMRGVALWGSTLQSLPDADTLLAPIKRFMGDPLSALAGKSLEEMNALREEVEPAVQKIIRTVQARFPTGVIEQARNHARTNSA